MKQQLRAVWIPSTASRVHAVQQSSHLNPRTVNPSPDPYYLTALLWGALADRPYTERPCPATLRPTKSAWQDLNLRSLASQTRMLTKLHHRQ